MDDVTIVGDGPAGLRLPYSFRKEMNVKVFGQDGTLMPRQTF